MAQHIRSLLVLLSASLMALPAYGMTASQTVEVEREVTQADGSIEVITTAPDVVLPGDTLIYSVNYFNDKDEVTNNFRIDMPIPAEVNYLEGSAQRENALILFSVDNGQTFAPRESLTVDIDGGGRRRANSDDITHIRWTLTEDVNPGDRGKMSFKGLLR